MAMATRSIVTSRPVLACDMCGRSLLRGEHPELFRVGAEPRTVCELCAPRAAHEGWLRESDIDDSLSLPPARRRRGGSLLGRLRQLREPAPWKADARRRPEPEPLGKEPEPLTAEADSLPEPDLSDETLERIVERDGQGRERRAQATGSEPERAVAIFNCGEHPRRMGGVARSLGTPTVTVRAVEGVDRRFTIVVAWELCWYRYEVDLDDEASGARLLEKGMELDELPGEDRSPNALADERGELMLTG
jgi:hypothetical protein